MSRKRNLDNAAESFLNSLKTEQMAIPLYQKKMEPLYTWIYWNLVHREKKASLDYKTIEESGTENT
jgi:hypothetical protein